MHPFITHIFPIGSYLSVKLSYRDEQSGNLIVEFTQPVPKKVQDYIFQIILAEMNGPGKLDAIHVPEESTHCLWADQTLFRTGKCNMDTMTTMATRALGEYREEIIIKLLACERENEQRKLTVGAMATQMKKTLIDQRSLRTWLKPGDPAVEALMDYLAGIIDKNEEKLKERFDPAKESTPEDPYHRLILLALKPAKDKKHADPLLEPLRQTISANAALANHIATELTIAVHAARRRAASPDL